MAQTADLTAPSATRSFRDPAGVLVCSEERIVRLVHPDAAEDVLAFLATDLAQRLIERGELVGTRRVGGFDGWSLAAGTPEEPCATPQPLVLEHERIPFASFPYEWPPEMLHAAGALTLQLAFQTLPEGFGLKDATPYNVLFRGPNPVFVDLLSFERRQPGDETWRAYAQFIRTFLLPLLASRHFGVSISGMLLDRRDGIEPDELYRWCGPLRRLCPPFLSLVSLPTWLGKRAAKDPGLYENAQPVSPDRARFVLGALFRGLQRSMNAAEPRQGRSSRWTDYLAAKAIYSEEQFHTKDQFVRDALARVRPKRVLDVGCNEGHFSLLSANAGASVVGIDYDPVVVGKVWKQARAENLDILPLVVDLAHPTPAVGWRNRECQSFLDRSRGTFDMVLMLAVVHHMLVTERIPLEEIMDLAADLTTDFALIEFVGPEDPMFRQIARGRESLFAGLTRAKFEAAVRPRFDIVQSVEMGGLARWLYLLKKR